jgi:hypothetical protein
MALDKPNFLIVGVQKAGTTFLAKALAEHPEVYFSTPKEVFFFNREKLNRQDFNVYLFDHFQGSSSHRWRGEGSTNYFHHPFAMRHIQRLLGSETRIIVCLRHPVERLLSHYLHDYRRGRRRGDEVLQAESFAGYSARSFYYDRLRAWRRRFPYFQTMIFDDLIDSGVSYFKQACDFLEIAPQHIEDRPVNEGMRLIWDGDVLTLLGKAGSDQVPPRFSRSDIEELVGHYCEDVSKTEDLLGISLAAWSEMPNFGNLDQKFGSERSRREAR